MGWRFEERLSDWRGEFEYELPFLRISVNEINFFVEAESNTRAAYQQQHRTHHEKESSYHPTILVLTDRLLDKECIVTYRFGAAYLKPKRAISR